MNVRWRVMATMVAIFGLFTISPLFWHMGGFAAAAEPPMYFNPVEPGESAFYGYGLTQFVAESASVTGPFLIAAQTSYAYGTIDGIHFAPTASTNGQCNPDLQYECSSDLFIEQLPSTTTGLKKGTVTLSDGTSFEVIGNVFPPGVIVNPRSLYPPTLPGNGSDPMRLSFTNTTSAPLTMGKAAFIDENASGAASALAFNSGCGSSLAAGATCIIDVSFAPTTDVYVEGFIEVPTSAGPIDVKFNALPYSFTPPLVKIDPQYLNFYVDSDGNSAVRTITMTNLSTAGPEYVSIVGAEASCDPVAEGSCLKILSNDCATIPLRGSCHITAQFLANPSVSFSGADDTLNLSIEPSNADAQNFSIEDVAFPAPGPPSAAVITVSPTTLQFPAVIFGQASDPKSLTVTNTSSRTLTVAIPSLPNFISDSSCVQLLPGGSCEVLVRYVPTSSYPNSVGYLIVTATDVADPTGLSSLQAQQVIRVTGSSISQAAVASPVYAGVAPITVNSSVSLNVTNTSDIPLIFGAISGNRNYYAGQSVIVDTTGCGASLAPGQSCALVVNGHKCTGGDGNPADGPCFLTIESNAWSSPDVYPLVGDETIDSHSILTVDAGPVVFGHTPTGIASASQVVQVTLTNANLSVSEAFNVLPILDPDFKVDNQCPKVLVPQAVTGNGYATSCQMLVTFVPQSQGFHVGALTYRSSLKGDSVVLAGTGIAPTVSVTPSSLKFASTDVGSSSPAQAVTLKSSGNSPIMITAITLIGGQADDYVLAKTCGGSLAAGASCTVAVTFKPVSAGTKLASISIADNADAAPQSVALSGIGSAAGAAPTVKLSATALTFAKQATGTSSAPQTVTLTNSGTAVLSLASITIAGGQADDYALTKTCGASLAAGSSCTLSVIFLPVSAGTKLASITLGDNASSSPQSITLTGAGTAANSLPSVRLSQTALTFTGQAPGTSSVSQTVTLNNSGGTTLTLTSITVIGGQADDYVLASTCGGSLPAGATCSLSVKFKPVSAGNKHASISIADNASGSPQSVALTGVGT